MLTQRLQTGGSCLDLVGHYVIFTKIAHALNLYVHFWTVSEAFLTYLTWGQSNMIHKLRIFLQFTQYLLHKKKTGGLAWQE